MPNVDENIKHVAQRVKEIKDLIPEAARYEQLAEECAELSQAALKVSRILRHENKTPLTKEQAQMALVEEFTDVLLSSITVDLAPDFSLATMKMDRWVSRNS